MEDLVRKGSILKCCLKILLTLLRLLKLSFSKLCQQHLLNLFNGFILIGCMQLKKLMTS